MLNNKINNEWKILKKGTRSDYSVIIGVTILLLLIIAMNVHLIFNMISNQTEGMGQMQLENIRSELQTTLNDAENTTKRIAIEAEQMMASNASKEQLTAYFEEQCKVQNAIFKDACMDVYIAGRDWAIIPNFDIPADYHPPERIWYKGAIENPDTVYITEPYLDARTGTMCYTMSIMLPDKQTVVALDFNFINTQDSVLQMNKEGGSNALIATKNGKIISYNDMSLVGEYISKKLPEYDIIFNKVVNQTTHASFSAQVDGSTHTIFSSETNNGWYMMLSVDNWALYKDDYKQTMLYTLASILMLLVVIFFYLVGVKNRLRAEQALRVKEEFLSNLSHELREPLQKILTLSNLNKMKTDVNHAENATQIRESAVQLSGMLDNLFTFSTLVSTENKNTDKDNQNMRISQTSHHVRIGIISVLIVAMIFSLGVCINNIINWGDTKMNREADIYDYQLSNWIARHKSILSMFTSMISERPQLMDNYETAVQWLNDIAKNYPEISVCYMANPYKEHTVIMNNGWEGPAGWHVDKRQWYIDTEKSETGFNISAPYYDDQTGLYCVTFSKMVYGKNGEFLGIFAIDFFLDKLIHILGNSYTQDGYAFLVDRNGVIINHPSSDFELSVDNTTPITITDYFNSYQNKSITSFTDYNGTYSTCLAKKNEASDFTVIIVSRWWNIYGSIVILGLLFILLFGICIAAVILLINK
ncbi:MAG: hypothetical protein IJ797_05685, partial [Selenomonadaceae bacterium]|nr:hypothetical protein [Selenomonadaceae bacterium]